MAVSIDGYGYGSVDMLSVLKQISTHSKVFYEDFTEADFIHTPLEKTTLIELCT